jgi:hypothetical protein
MKFARINPEQTFDVILGDNTLPAVSPEEITEVVEVESEAALSGMFHPDVVAQFKPVADEVQVGWIKKNGVYEAPPITPVVLDPTLVGTIPVGQLGATDASN